MYILQHRRNGIRNTLGYYELINLPGDYPRERLITLVQTVIESVRLVNRLLTVDLSLYCNRNVCRNVQSIQMFNENSN